MTATAAALGERLDRLLASDPAAMADPYPLYRELREAGRVFAHADAVFIAHHADVKSVIQDGVHYSNHASMGGSRATAIRASLTAAQRAAFDEVTGFEAHSVARADGEKHARLRAITHRAFLPRRIEALREPVQRYADDLVEELAGDEVADLMSLAYRLPLWVICDLLGVPAADRELVHGLSLRIARNRGGAEAGPLLDAHAAHHELRAYVGAMIEAHRRSAGSAGELVAALLDAEEQDRLDADELTATFVVMLVAGHETTTNLIGTGVLELLRTADEWRAIAADQALVPAAVEELLRYVSPAQWLPRRTVADVRIGETLVPAGTTVVPLLAAANRDPAVFEDAERLDVRRPDARRHIALGHGPHFCLGASLARLEGEIVLGTLARRLPDLALTGAPLEWTGNAVLRRLAALPVRPAGDRGRRS